MRWSSSWRSLFFNFSKPQSMIYRAYCKSVDSKQELSENPYYEKYAKKIAKIQKSPSEDIQTRLKKNLEVIGAYSSSMKKIVNTEQSESKAAKIPPIQKQKDLNQIMKLDLINNKSAEEIESIWQEYHKVKEGVYAVLPGNVFTKMHCNLKEYPTFLFPLPRAQGYEYIMCQFLDHSCYFTSVVNYQAFKENAPVCLTVTYYTEFQSEKGIILMRGEYDNTVLKAHEAQCLTNQLQLYYGSDDQDKLNLVHKFNRNPESFKHMELISNFESSLSKFTITN
ncbi:hypothetical protein JTE90_015869 [Oedothorax gibbosus]|uniref:ATP synthase mitochondrial F1 complex assembly factor 1 n=1 Tax=Oedothorax gibbosus TaxID=931172 RepID=A0AAV6VVW9_9ARAC|nr:hypothetical protein JTE90_015869 [Oedothorax gibbosus]